MCLINARNMGHIKLTKVYKLSLWTSGDQNDSFFGVLALLLPYLQLILYPHRLNLTFCFTVIHVRLQPEKRLLVNGQAHCIWPLYTHISSSSCITCLCSMPSSQSFLSSSLRQRNRSLQACKFSFTAWIFSRDVVTRADSFPNSWNISETVEVVVKYPKYKDCSDKFSSEQPLNVKQNSSTNSTESLEV